MLQSQMIRKANLNEMTQWQCQSINKFVNNLRLNSQFWHFKAGLPGICRGKDWLTPWNLEVTEQVQGTVELNSLLSRKSVDVFKST